MDRRKFVQEAGHLSLGALLLPAITQLTGKAKPTILLVSGWQDVNIGDIAHTPGLLSILEKLLDAG